MTTWTVIARRAGVAIEWERDGVTITKERRLGRSSAGLGSTRYYVRGLGDPEYGELTLEGAMARVENER